MHVIHPSLLNVNIKNTVLLFFTNAQHIQFLKKIVFGEKRTKEAVGMLDSSYLNFLEKRSAVRKILQLIQHDINVFHSFIAISRGSMAL